MLPSIMSCANKVLANDEPHFSEAIRPAVRPTTTLVSVHNGVNVEQSLRHVFRDSTILSAVCYISCQQTSPGVVRQVSQIRPHAFHIGASHQGMGDVNTENEKLQSLVNMDDKFKAVQDVKTERWTKMLFNGAWNPIAALTGLDTHQLLDKPIYLEIIQRLVEEIYTVAIKSGAVLPADLPARTVQFAQTAAPIVPSMLQDAKHKRTMEIEALCGISHMSTQLL